MSGTKRGRKRKAVAALGPVADERAAKRLKIVIIPTPPLFSLSVSTNSN